MKGVEQGSWDLFKWGSYLMLGGLLVAFSLEVYGLANLSYLSSLFTISPSEAFPFFIAVETPSLVVAGVAGYVLFTTRREPISLERTFFLLTLEMIVVVASSLAASRIVSFVGGILLMVATLRLYLAPTYGTVSRSGVAFIAALGALELIYFSTLYIVIWLIFNNFLTYSYGNLSQITSRHLAFTITTAVIGLLAGFTALAIRLLKSSIGIFSAALLLQAIVLTIVATFNFYPLFNTPGYLALLAEVAGILLLYGAGIIALQIAGRSRPSFESMTPTPQPGIPTYAPPRPRARFCPECGTLQKNTDNVACESCGRILVFKPNPLFCPYCGHTVAPNTNACPQCHEKLK